MQQKCPRCRTDSFLSKRHSVLVHLSDWPTMALFALLLIIAGNLLALASEVVAIAIVIAVLPLFFSLLEKHECERCGIEFRSTADLTTAGLEKPEA